MKLTFKNKLAYSSAAIGDAAAYSVVGTYLMFFLTTVVHLSPAAAGTLIAVGSVWDVICSLVIGFRSDHSESKMGRRRPYLLVGATLLAISCSLLFYTIDAGPMVKAAYYGLMILVFWTGFSTFYVPYLALGAEFTDDYNERTHLRSYAYGFNIIGTLLGIVLPSILVDLLFENGMSVEGAWHLTGTFIGVASAISIYITIALAKDKDEVRTSGERKNEKLSARYLVYIVKGYAEVLELKPFRYLMLASIFYLIANTVYNADRLYYYTYNLGFDAVFVTTVLLFASFIGMMFMPVILMLTRWMDKRSLLILMMLISALLVFSAKLTGVTTMGGMLLFTFVYGIGSAAYWQLMPAMLYDICEYDELKTGNRRKGSIVSLQSVSEAFSQAAAMQLLGIVLQLAGFHGEAAVQTALALEWVENSLMMIPPVFMVLTAIMVFRYPITKKKFEEIQAELKKRS